jgi:hypothetical protein
MATVPREKNGEQEKDATAGNWWYVAQLIAGIDASPTQKYFLTLIQTHTNKRRRYAWASQRSLAAEMGTDVSTVNRSFRWGKQLGVVGVRRVRTGKGKMDQYNEYWIVTERLKELQRPRPTDAPPETDQHTAPMPSAQPEHTAPMPSASADEHTSFGTTSTRQIPVEHTSFDGEAHGTHAVEGFEVKQCSSNSVNQRGAVSENRSPRASVTSPSEDSEKQKLLNRLHWGLRFEWTEKKPQERNFTGVKKSFHEDARALSLEWREQCSMYDGAYREERDRYDQETATKAMPKAKPVVVPTTEADAFIKGEIVIGHKSSTLLWARSAKYGWRNEVFQAFLKKHFGVKVPKYLTVDQYHQAWRELANGPPN